MKEQKNFLRVTIYVILVSITILFSILLHLKIRNWYKKSAAVPSDFGCLSVPTLSNPVTRAIGIISHPLTHKLGTSVIDYSRVDWCLTPRFYHLLNGLFHLMILITISTLYWSETIRLYLARIKNKTVWRIFYLLFAAILYITLAWTALMLFTQLIRRISA